MFEAYGWANVGTLEDLAGLKAEITKAEIAGWADFHLAQELNWAGAAADFDFYVRNGGNTAFVGSTSASAGSSQPETQSISLAAGTYWIVAVNWSHLADPSWVFLVVQ